VKQACLDLAPHETILEIIVDDIPRRGLNRNDADINLLVRSCPFCRGLGQAEQVATRWCAGTFRRLVELASLVDVRALCIDVRELPDERGVAVVARFLERCRLELANNTDFVTGGNQAFDMNI
jgi:hypothetical protein